MNDTQRDSLAEAQWMEMMIEKKERTMTQATSLTPEARILAKGKKSN